MNKSNAICADRSCMNESHDHSWMRKNKSPAITGPKKQMASKMYSTSRCGKCNRFGHSHEKCEKGKIDMKAFHLKHGDYPDAKPGSDYMGAK